MNLKRLPDFAASSKAEGADVIDKVSRLFALLRTSIF